MSSNANFAAMDTNLPSSTPDTLSSSPNSWGIWIYSWFSRSAPESNANKATGQHPLEESDIFANWEAILSQEDQLLATKAKVERQQRLQEIHSIQDAAKGLKKMAQNEATYARLFGAPFLSNEELVACKNPLEPNTRSAIISKLLHWYSGSYLKALQRLYFADETHNAASWDIFVEGYQETKYKKGIVGSMKDIAVLIYHGVLATGLTGKILHQIIMRWINILSKAYQELVDREIRPEEIDLIQKVVSESIAGPLIRLHCDVAKKSVEALKRGGRLPGLWAEQDKARFERLQELKRAGAVDARWEENQRWSRASESSIVDGNQKAAAAMLERTLTFRAPAPLTTIKPM